MKRERLNMDMEFCSVLQEVYKMFMGMQEGLKCDSFSWMQEVALDMHNYKQDKAEVIEDKDIMVLEILSYVGFNGSCAIHSSLVEHIGVTLDRVLEVYKKLKVSSTSDVVCYIKQLKKLYKIDMNRYVSQFY